MGIPVFILIFPLKPRRFCFFRITFKIPAVPSAEYLADGDVTTSTFSIDSDGSYLKPWGPDSADGLPFIKILTLLFPRSDMFPSKSTSMDGIFAWLQRNAALGHLFTINLKPVGDKKFLFSTCLEYLSAGLILFLVLGIIR